ncbi:MAG: sulfurtransferase TusA family protein [Candidatus Thorarchaeota archaeon]|jgi:tRNA 2-thiouridine synthesizing protein A
MADHQVAKEFDASGLRCPMPILQTKKQIKTIEIGEIIKIIATDIGTKKDFPAFASRTGNEIVELVEEGDKLIWYIKRTK